MHSVIGNRERPDTYGGSMSEHKKLCRVSYGTKVPLDSTSATLIADLSGVRINVAETTNFNQYQQPPTLRNTVSYGGGGRKRLETVDSDPCYSSDGEHSTLSRNASTNSDCIGGLVGRNDEDFSSEHHKAGDLGDVLTCDTASSAEYSKNAVDSRDSGYSSSLPYDSGELFTPPLPTSNAEYAELLEYALKLGYSENQLRSVLTRLFSNQSAMVVGKDRVLAELIKLGQDVSVQESLVVDNLCNNGSKNNLHSSAPSDPSNALRAIVIDGSNVAMTHGHKEVFSCKGIKECVDWFRKRGHTDITVIVPSFRKEAPRPDAPITDQHILFQLEKEHVLCCSPSRRVNGRRIVCHDDNYIVKAAADKEAVVVSNDEFRDIVKNRDIMKDTPELKKVIEERLLMYSFVDGKFMPPDDPLGRYGPKLEQFLRVGGVNATAQTCPYGRKCTYGSKCKYYHPERPGGGYRSVTDRLKEHADFHRQLSPSGSLQSPPHMINADANVLAQQNSRQPACRSQSLNQQAFLRHESSSPGRLSPLAANSKNASPINDSVLHQDLSKRLSSPDNVIKYIGAEGSSRNAAQRSPQRQQLQQQSFCIVGADGFLMPPSLHSIWQANHQPVGRNLSAPGYNSSFRANVTTNVGNVLHGNQNGCWNYASNCHQQRKNSISDSQINFVGHNFYGLSSNSGGGEVGSIGDVFHDASSTNDDSGFGTPPSDPNNWYVPSTTVWGPLENSSVPIFTSGPGSAWRHRSPHLANQQHDWLTRVNTLPAYATQQSQAAASRPFSADDGEVASNEEKRRKLNFHLSELFPEDIVAAVMAAHPEESDPQKLCQLIIAVHQSGAQI